jgi:hypothetical protein
MDDFLTIVKKFIDIKPTYNEFLIHNFNKIYVSIEDNEKCYYLMHYFAMNTIGFVKTDFDKYFSDYNNSLIVQRKEIIVLNYIKNKFPNLNIINNKSNGSKKRPDILIKLKTYDIIIEVDENQHKGYDEINETERIKIWKSFSNRSIIMIRFNPDSYTSNNVTYKGITEDNKIKNERLQVLCNCIQDNLNINFNEEIKIIKLFYDNYNQNEKINSEKLILVTNILVKLVNKIPYNFYMNNFSKILYKIFDNKNTNQFQNLIRFLSSLFVDEDPTYIPNYMIEKIVDLDNEINKLIKLNNFINNKKSDNKITQTIIKLIKSNPNIKIHEILFNNNLEFIYTISQQDFYDIIENCNIPYKHLNRYIKEDFKEIYIKKINTENGKRVHYKINIYDFIMNKL